jgi:hypothetical protein
MKQISKWSIILILVAIAIGNLWGQANTNVSALEAAREVPTAVAHTISQATVQVTMIGIEWGEQTVVQSDERQQTFTISSKRHIDKGIGTLLTYEGETLLVSHDHWSHLTSTVVPDLVQFHDADGRFLLEMTGDAFSQLVLFRDGGTLIMRAPQALTAQLPNAAAVGHVASLMPGDIVYVAHRQANQNDTGVLMAAAVLAVESDNNIPLFSLRSLNGQVIEPGDSGGGVWVNGRYVGNLWMTVREVSRDWWRFYQPTENTTTRSYAAGLTEDLLELVSVVIEPQELPEIQADSPS